MARFEMNIPTAIINEMENLTNNCDEMIKAMCMAGAEVAKQKIYMGMPAELKKYATPKTLNVTKSYIMQSTGARAVYVWFGGYKQDLNETLWDAKYSGGYTKEKAKAFRKEAGTPLELIANMFEYGSKKRNYPKHPFLRKAFHKREIERAMLKAQKQWIKEDAEFK